MRHTRRCKHCSLLSDNLELFVLDKASKYNRRNFCKECWNKKGKGNPKMAEYKHRNQLAKRYAITPERYVECMETSHTCQICNSEKNLCYDHNHSSMEFRGVLCRACNKAIGQLGDTPEALLRAYTYLKDTH